MLSQMTMTLAEHHDARIRWRHRDPGVPIVVEEDAEGTPKLSDTETLRGEVVESGDARWPQGLYMSLKREDVEEA